MASTDYLFENDDKTLAPLDVWLKFDAEDDEEPTHEANTFLTDDKTFRVDWYNTSVGEVTSKEFDTYAEAVAWLEPGGYEDFSS